MLTALLTVLLFFILIIPHEFGHFLAAKLVGIQVNEFSAGIGPALFQRKKGETMYSVRLFPVGGYCAMEGENEEIDNPRAFNSKKVWQKLVVLFAGAFMNLLIAVLLTIIAVMIIGVPVNKLDKVVKDSPAYEAGLRSDDTIVSVDGKSVKTWSDTVSKIEKTKSGEVLTIGVLRDSKVTEHDVIPEVKDDRMVIGIQAHISHSVIACTGYGLKASWNMNNEMISGLKTIFSRGIKKTDVGGPVRIVKIVNDTKNYGVSSFLYLAAIISLNLAYINLLPFPALDGGRIVFVVIRKITGNMITDKTEGMVHLAGMLVLLILFVFVTWNDISMLIK